MIMTKTDRSALEAMYVIKEFVEHLPDWLKPKLSKNNDHQMFFEETDSKLFCYTPECSRGRSLSNIYLDEAAFWTQPDKYWKAMFPTIATGGRACILSTPNGKNWFYQMYHDAENRKNDFVVCPFEFSEHPVYSDEEWQKKIYKQLGFKGFHQEVLAQFENGYYSANSIEEEVDILQKLDPNWQPEVQPHEYKKQVFVQIGDDDSWEDWETSDDNKYVHEWEKISPEKVKSIFKEEHKYWEVSDTDHPEWETPVKLDTLEDLYEFWGGASECGEGHPQVAALYGKALAEKRARMQEIEDNLSEYCEPEMLALGGLMEEEEVAELKMEMGEGITRSGRLDIIKKILDEGNFPENLNLGIHKEYLSINGVPTNIMTDAVKWAYMGLTALTSHEEAVEHVASILKDKIKKLF